MQHRTLAIACLGLATIFGSSMAEAQYQLKNLVSNQVKHAAHTDPLLVNGWGLVHGPGTPWWISDNNSGWALVRRIRQTSYNAQGIDSYGGKWAEFSKRIERAGIANGKCF